MRLSTRHLVNRSFSGLGYASIALLTAALLVLLGPIFIRGSKAFVFRGTVEYRVMMREAFNRGPEQAVDAELAEAREARRPAFERLAAFEKSLEQSPELRRQYGKELREVKDTLRDLLGPLPGEPRPLLMRKQYGQTRWDRAQVKLRRFLYKETWDYGSGGSTGVKVEKPRKNIFAGTDLEPLFGEVESGLAAMLRPRWTLYGRFLSDKSFDAHFFGGIGPELLGTLCLTLGALLFAMPVGVVSAVYLTEYASEGRLVNALRTCISTLAGVPSIVFGLFGLAFFINTLQVSKSKSVLAGSLTLGLLVLPTIIRAAEEALRAVPQTYKEAALSLGSSRWHSIIKVILPAALPGILTGVIISIGRAAGETAPIIFTAAVSMGDRLAWNGLLLQPTPVLSWNIFNLSTEHAAVDEIRHVQYGMVMVLILLVLLLNAAALFFRARITRNLKG